MIVPPFQTFALEQTPESVVNRFRRSYRFPCASLSREHSNNYRRAAARSFSSSRPASQYLDDKFATSRLDCLRLHKLGMLMSETTVSFRVSPPVRPASVYEAAIIFAVRMALLRSIENQLAT